MYEKHLQQSSIKISYPKNRRGGEGAEVPRVIQYLVLFIDVFLIEISSCFNGNYFCFKLVGFDMNFFGI